MNENVRWGGCIFIGMWIGYMLAMEYHKSAIAASTPITASNLQVTAADIGFAKEVCHHKHLSWSSIELAEDGTHVNVLCMSSEVVAAQTRARWIGQKESVKP